MYKFVKVYALFLLALTNINSHGASCQDLIEAAQKSNGLPHQIGKLNPSLPRRFHQTVYLSEQLQEIEATYKTTFFDLVGFKTFIFTAGPGVGLARSFASHVIKNLATNKNLNSKEKALLWIESRKIFRILSPEWDMQEVTSTQKDEFVFQGSTPAIPDSDMLPILYIDSKGDIYTGIYPKITHASQQNSLNMPFKEVLTKK